VGRPEDEPVIGAGHRVLEPAGHGGDGHGRGLAGGRQHRRGGQDEAFEHEDDAVAASGLEFGGLEQRSAEDGAAEEAQDEQGDETQVGDLPAGGVDREAGGGPAHVADGDVVVGEQDGVDVPGDRGEGDAPPDEPAAEITVLVRQVEILCRPCA